MSEFTYRATHGEPVKLRGDAAYFTSWKYVRPPRFAWATDASHEDAAGPTAPHIPDGDAGLPARFDPRDAPWGVKIRSMPAEKLHGAIPGRPLAVLHDEGRYKIWYYFRPDADPAAPDAPRQFIAYAESSDGIEWEKPELGLVEHNGNKRNNLLFRSDREDGGRGVGGATVFIDPSSTDERYKLIHSGRITADEWAAFERDWPGEASPTGYRLNVFGKPGSNAVFGAVSADGLNWRFLPEPLLIYHCDTQNTCYYDVDLQEYVAYIRMWQSAPIHSPEAERSRDSWTLAGRRSIGRATSRDFRHFSKPEIVVAPGADMDPCHLWYTNCKTTLPGAPDQHVMFPWRWETDCDGGDCFLFSSADGWAWAQVPGGPALERGPNGAADGGFIIAGPHLMELPDGRWALPYDGYPVPHKYPSPEAAGRGLLPGVEDIHGLAVWPRGRIAALDCPKEGAFATVAFMPPGRRLRLNADIRPSGWIQVQVHALGRGDVAGRAAADTDRLLGDSLAHEVTWNGDPDIGAGDDPVMFHFHLRHTRLYGIEFH